MTSYTTQRVRCMCIYTYRQACSLSRMIRMIHPNISRIILITRMIRRFFLRFFFFEALFFIYHPRHHPWQSAYNPYHHPSIILMEWQPILSMPIILSSSHVLGWEQLKIHIFITILKIHKYKNKNNKTHILSSKYVFLSSKYVFLSSKYVF